MTISTYSQLKDAIKAWSKRSDLDAYIPDFIALAEKRIKSLVDVRTAESEVSLVTAVNDDKVPLPSDFKNPIALWVSDINPREQITQLLPQSLPYSSTPSRPLYWAIDGTSIRFQSPTNQAYPIRFRYEQLFELSDSNPTNYLLSLYSEVYLFSSLVELFTFAFDEQRGEYWEKRFQDAAELCNDQEHSNNQNVPLRTEFAHMGRQRFNIYRGI